ncbi:hypothetical protein RHMOL_Rhmol08G0122600 [Rhododendron molle]|uniref:Uncharacterized protein n=1 Tax=Rhododendron molle TaxID=49168 RepID=A0ACC0MMW9_RHOML|nr:hypothetical protein RHMOL_Rhmol08G0122600 [Rhododendron molle]
MARTQKVTYGTTELDTSKINRALLRRCQNQPSLEVAILFFPEKERDAPAILKYTATYQGFIRQKETPPVATKETAQCEQQQEQENGKVVFEDSFGEIPDILLPSVHHPLRGKLRVAREESTDKERDEEVEMAPRDILVDLEKRKKKRQEDEKTNAAAKSGPSAGDLAAKASRATGSKVPPLSSPSSKRSNPSATQKDVSKDIPAEKRQKTTATGSGPDREISKGKGAATLAPAWRPQFVTPEKC